MKRLTDVWDSENQISLQNRGPQLQYRGKIGTAGPSSSVLGGDQAGKNLGKIPTFWTETKPGQTGSGGARK